MVQRPAATPNDGALRMNIGVSKAFVLSLEQNACAIGSVLLAADSVLHVDEAGWC